MIHNSQYVLVGVCPWAVADRSLEIKLKRQVSCPQTAIEGLGCPPMLEAPTANLKPHKP